MLLSTPYKPKIGRQQSFAIGARDLSDALTGVSQDGSLQLAFGKALGRDDGYVAVSLGYHYDPQRGIGPAWTVWVRAVPRGSKHTIKALLIDRALPKVVRPWLAARADLLGTIGDEVLDLVFYPAKESIVGLPGLSTKPLEPRRAKRDDKTSA